MLLGDQSLAPSADSNGAGTAQAFAYQATASGTTSDIELYANSGTTATKLMLGLYSDASGKPGSLLASGSIASPKSSAWNDVKVGAVTLSAGTKYWIALLATGGKIAYPDTWGGSAASYVESASGLTSLPATYSAGGEYNASPASAYVLGAAPPAAPTNSTAPAVSGQTVQGDTLTTGNGSWTGSPSSYAYQWQDCNSSGGSCANISGAKSSTYVLQASDAGSTMRSVVTASNAGGATSASSAPTATVSKPPAVLLGDQSLAPSADSNGAGTAQAFAYQATTSGTTSDIELYANSGTTATKLMLGLYSDASGKPGSLLTSGSMSSPKSSAWNDVKVGSVTLSAGTTYWVALLATGGQIAYPDTWGGSAASYVESASGLTSLPATYSAGAEYNAGPASAYVLGPAGTSGPAAPTDSSAPAVSGQAAQGSTLSTSNGTWTGSPSSYAYQWQDCNSSGGSCASISGAKSSTYTLQASDVGSTIRSVVTATNPGGSTAASSAPTATVTPLAPTNTTAPSVTGQAVQGSTLSTSNGSWTGSPSSYAYQWQDCNSAGGSCASISGANSSTYTLQASDVGDTVRSVVTATNSGGRATASSAATAVVVGSAPAHPNPGSGLSSDPGFFPVLVWDQSGFNASAYGSVGVNVYENGVAYSSSQLAQVKAAGLSVIECSVNGQDAGSTYLGADGNTYTNYSPSSCPYDGRGDASESVIKGWLVQPDEPDTAQLTGASSYGPCIAPSQIQNETRAVQAGDDLSPKRATIINFNGGVAIDTTARGSYCHYLNNYAQYMQDATIANFDVYPVNYGHPLDSNAVGVRNLHSWMTAAGQDKPVFVSIETTPIHSGASGPTAAQLHFEIWNSIIAGANGINYFCHIITPSFNEAGCLSIPAIKAQMTSDDAQIKTLAPVLNSGTVTPGVSASASYNIDVMTKRSGTDTYALTDADNPTGGPATFTVPGGGTGTVTVLGENRTLPMTNGTFTDSFTGYGVHLYQIQPSLH